jgi:hypothetical protein
MARGSQMIYFQFTSKIRTVCAYAQVNTSNTNTHIADNCKIQKEKGQNRINLWKQVREHKV